MLKITIRSFAIIVFVAAIAAAQTPQGTTPPANPPAASAPSPAHTAPKASTPPKTTPPKAAPASPAAQSSAPDPNAELQKAVQSAGNDDAALVRNLEDYLRRFPDAPQKMAIYRALVKSQIDLHNNSAALDYAQRIITAQPDDAEMLFVAIRLLKDRGSADDLKLSTDYATRLIDQVEKITVDMKPAQMSVDEWTASRAKTLTIVYIVRGELEMDRKDTQAATADLEKSYGFISNAQAAMDLGEIAELDHQPDKAITEYVTAFTLPDVEGVTVDRASLHRKLANLWQIQHGSVSGLGERLLQAYDENDAKMASAAPRPTYNADAKGASAFVLRRPDGAAPYKIADAKGKIVVLHFWATWCTPCSEVEPLLDQTRAQYADKSDVVFLDVNNDENEALVKPYMDRQKIGSTVVFSDGLDHALDVKAFPTVLILDRSGKVAYRAEGFDPAKFAQDLKAAIDRAIAGAS